MKIHLAQRPKTNVTVHWKWYAGANTNDKSALDGLKDRKDEPDMIKDLPDDLTLTLTNLNAYDNKLYQDSDPSKRKNAGFIKGIVFVKSDGTSQSFWIDDNLTEDNLAFSSGK